MRGGQISPAEATVHAQTMLLLELLEAGLSWEAIMQLDEEEANRILSVHIAKKQKQQEDLEAARRP